MISFIKSLIQEAGDKFESSKTTIVSKHEGVANWTTEADLAVEKLIIAKIKAKYPGHFIISEESQIPEIPSKNAPIWLIDPLDGTTNAVNRIPFYGISIAFMEKGEVQRGAILNLNTHELYWAEKGKGTFAGDKKLKMEDRPIKNALVSVGVPYEKDDFLILYKLMMPIIDAGGRIEIFRCCVIESMYVVEGKFVLCFNVGIKPWDVAAASLIVEEAGGAAESFKGKLDVLNPKTYVCGTKTAVCEFKVLL